MAADLATWLTKQQAADAIGVSTKAIERWAKAGKLEQAARPQAGSPDVAVYFPEDVARIASERRPAAGTGFLVPGQAAVQRNGNGHHAGEQPTGDSLSTFAPPIVNPGEDLFRVLVTAAVRVMSETSQTHTLFLTIAEASALAGLPQADIRRACESGELCARKTGRGGWRIKRTDLEQL